ncbi:MAG: ABC transporter ATP-binding protein [Propionibacteriaceae bacterium]|nr:ABC transporter ATP-binding protein [Propionibacteriaceae bacterium]
MRQSLSIDIDYPIEVSGARKRFGAVAALDGLDLRVRRGEVHGFLGPNGAGKSTTIRALLGQIRLSGGRATVYGADPWRYAPSIHEHVAYVPGDTVLWPNLTGGECIDLISRLQGSPDARRRAELVERFDLDPRRRAGTYSKGNRQKVALISVLATQASLLILDEPTSGLDPVMERQFIHTVKELVGEGRTVLLSSHLMSEIDALCDRVTIIRGGRTVITAAIPALRAQARVAIQATFPQPLSPGVLPEGATATFEDGLHTVSLSVARSAVTDTVAVLTANQPRDLTVAPATFDELFWQHYDGGT